MSRTLLQNLYLFKSLNPQELDAISAVAKLENFQVGDSIFLRGEAAKALYLIKFGSIRIQQETKSGDTVTVASLGTGSHFGEMAFVDGEARSATAVAAERSEIVVIDYEALTGLLKKAPETAAKIYREMAHFLAGRLRVTTSDLNFAREKNLSHF